MIQAGGRTGPMIPIDGDPAHWLFVTAGAIMALALLAAFLRLLRGPTPADRVVALDLLGFVAVGALAAYAIASQRDALLGVALIAAIVLFLGTAGFALYLYRRSSP